MSNLHNSERNGPAYSSMGKGSGQRSSRDLELDSYQNDPNNDSNLDIYSEPTIDPIYDDLAQPNQYEQFFSEHSEKKSIRVERETEHQKIHQNILEENEIRVDNDENEPAAGPEMLVKSFQQDNNLNMPSISKMNSISEDIITEKDRGQSGVSIGNDIALVKASNNQGTTPQGEGIQNNNQDAHLFEVQNQDKDISLKEEKEDEKE